jgi:hypothetical protein
VRLGKPEKGRRRRGIKTAMYKSRFPKNIMCHTITESPLLIS